MKKLLFLGLIFVFCGCNEMNSTFSDEEVDSIIIEGNHFSIVEDQYGNQYIKEHTYYYDIYVPYKMVKEEEEEEETPDAKSYEAKINNHVDRRLRAGSIQRPNLSN
jgi:hypothetical protein